MFSQVVAFVAGGQKPVRALLAVTRDLPRSGHLLRCELDVKLPTRQFHTHFIATRGPAGTPGADGCDIWGSAHRVTSRVTT